MSDKENAVLNEDALVGEAYDFDELERQLESGIEDSLSELEFLEEDKSKISNPENLGNAVMDVVWDQFIIQIGAVAGDDFVKENRGLKLDLRNDAHIQTADNFEMGKIATHNFDDNYQAKYDEYRGQFKTDPNKEYRYKDSPNHHYDEKTKTWFYVDPKTKESIPKERYNKKIGVWEEFDNIDGEWKKILKDNSVRKPYDEGRPVGKNGKHMDHQVSAGEYIRDPAANAFMSKEERVNTAISDVNLNELDSAANESKGDHNGEKWSKHIRNGKHGEGESNAEYFGIDEEDFSKKDQKAREYKDEKVKEAENKAIKSGKQSQKAEAFRIGGKALRAAVMGLLAELIRNIIGKLIEWLKSKEKNLKSFLNQVKEAISTFIRNLKQNLLTTGATVASTVLNAIFGPVVSAIQKIWALIKQGGKSVKEAIDYVKAPENRGKSFGILMLEVGKIIMTGLTAMGALALGEVIEKGLLTFPIFATEIPLLGSLANIIGIFLGAVVAGIAGALVLNLIDKLIAKKKKDEITEAQIDKGNEILSKQNQLREVYEEHLEAKKEQVHDSIKENHERAGETIKESLKKIQDTMGTESEEALLDMIRKSLG